MSHEKKTIKNLEVNHQKWHGRKESESIVIKRTETGREMLCKLPWNVHLLPQKREVKKITGKVTGFKSLQLNY